jgi:hypothetical protein
MTTPFPPAPTEYEGLKLFPPPPLPVLAVPETAFPPGEAFAPPAPPPPVPPLPI